MAVALLAGADASAQSWLDDPLATQDAVQSRPPLGCELIDSQKKQLALVDAVRMALCHNPQTRNSWANVMIEAARLGSARSAYLPSLSADADVTHSRNDGVSLNEGTSSGPGLSLSYLLYDFGAREANNDLTRQSLLAADYTHNATLQKVMFAAIQAYYQMYSADASVAAAKETVTSTRAGADAATYRHKTGAAAIADQLQAETAYAQAVLSLEQARNQREIAKGTLANVMGVAPDTVFNLPSSAPDMLAADLGQKVADMLELAKRHRPDLAAAAAQLGAAKANVDVQKAGALPTISVTGNQQFNRQIEGSGIDSDTSAVMLRMSIPLFTGFDRDYQIKAAEQQAEAQAASFRDTENNTLLDVWKSYNNFDTAKHTIGMTDALMASARKSEQVALGRYKAGAGTITDYLSAQASMASARQQHVAAVYNVMIAKADLLRALGTLDQKSIAGMGSPKGVP